MQTAYKLTDEEGYTRRGKSGETLWRPGVVLRTNGEGKLCGSGWVHAYEHPHLAILHNPIHANYQSPRLWEVEIDGTIKRDGQMKLGAAYCRCLREIPVPVVSHKQIIAYGILCSLEVYDEHSYVRWAKAWLTGADRSAAAAWAAGRAAWAEEAAWAAEEAAWAAEAAAGAAAARAAERAEWVAEAKHLINLIEIAEKAMNYK